MNNKRNNDENWNINRTVGPRRNWRGTAMPQRLLLIAIVVIAACASSAQAQWYSATPESRYWAQRSARNYAQAGLGARRGNFVSAGRNFYYGARNTGRTLYFGSRDYRANRDVIRRSPSWDSRRRWFR